MNAILLLLSGILMFTSDISAQTFVRVTDANNPIVTGGGPAGYAGASWIDFDNDGDLDLFVNNDKLYRNDGNGTFVRLTTVLGSGQPITTQIIGNGNSWADFDNDGDLDCFVSSATSFLYRNDGDGVFTKVTTGTIGAGSANRGWSCAWADYNNDGNIDLAITHPAGFIPPGNIPTMNHLLLNDGPPDYTFTRVTDIAITTNGFAPYTVGTWSDFDQDGDMDYFIGTGPATGVTAPDYLFRNLQADEGQAIFERITENPIATDQQDGQVWNWIDYDNDGDLDAYLTNWGGGGQLTGMVNRLYRNDNGAFTGVTSGAIVTDADISLSSIWGDFDNDGDLDCWVANDRSQQDRYYQNSGDGTFTSISNIAIASSLTHRGGSAGDYDNDGDLDLLAVGPTNNIALYRNTTQNGNHWINLTCTGTESNRAAIGARVYAKALLADVPLWQMREILAQNTFNGHNSLRVHFGLADATVVDSLVIKWPSGSTDIYTNVSTNAFYRATEGNDLSPLVTAVDIPAGPPSGFILYLNYPNPFNPNTTITYNLPFKTRVRLEIHNILGERIRVLAEGEQRDGQHSLNWDGKNELGQYVPSGTYYYRLSTAGFVQSRNMLLIR